MQHSVIMPPEHVASPPGPSPWARWLVALFMFATVLAPASPANKVVFLLLVGWLALDLLFSSRHRTLPTLAPLAVLCIFAYGLLLALVTRTEQAIAVQYFTSVLVLFLFYFVHHHRIDLDALVEATSLLLIAGMALFWASIAWPDLPLAGQVFAFFDAYNFSAATEREFFEGGATFTLQLGTTPFLFVGMCIVSLRCFSPARRRTDPAFLLLILAAIAASGLRGLVVVALALLGAMLVARAGWVWRVVLGIALTVALVAAYFALSDTLLFSAQEESNAVKLGHFNSFLSDMTSESFLFGRGLGSYYFSTGSEAYRSYTELTPIDIARYIGVPLTLAFYLLLLFPVARLQAYSGRLLYVLTLFLYIVLSMTNPVMVNSYGMLVVVWYWTKVIPAKGAPA